MKPKERAWRKAVALIGAVLFCGGMLVAGLWDLPINQAAYNPQNPIAIAFECFGYYPLYLIPMAWVLLMAIDSKNTKARRVLASATAAVVVLGLFAYSVIGLEHRNVGMALVFCWGVWVLIASCFLKLVRAEQETLRRVRFVLGWGVFYAAANTVLINVLKMLWQRTRFDDLVTADSFVSFTPWYSLPGSGGSSFPSGHTAAACGVFVLVLLCDVLPQWRNLRAVVWVGCWTYVVCMAVNRIVIGRHYLSDTLMAMFVMTLLFVVLTRTNTYKNGVHIMCAKRALRADAVQPQTTQAAQSEQES